MLDAARFLPLPRAELHVHLDGSLRPGTLLELAAQDGVALPAGTPDALRSHMRVDDAKNLDDYLRRFSLTVAVLQQAAGIERVAFEMVEDAARDGVRYLEVRYCPALSCDAGLTLDEVLAAMAAGLDRGSAVTGVGTGIISCTLRHFDPALSCRIAEASARQRGRGVVGFDLAGAEAHFAAAPHRRAFAIAREAGLGITVHAGEAAGPASIAEAIHTCGADRIGHGTRLIEDAGLLALVRDRRIPVEVSITSNVQTRAVDVPGHHPLRAFLDAGLVTSLCTDNWLMSDVTLSSEFALAEASLALTPAEVQRLARTGFESAFLPPDRRVALLSAVSPAIGAFR